MRHWQSTALAAGIVGTLAVGQPLLLTHLVKRGAANVRECATDSLRNINDLYAAVQVREPIHPDAVPALRSMLTRISQDARALLRIQDRLDPLGPDDGWSGITLFNAPDLAFDLWREHDACTVTYGHVLVGFTMLQQYTVPKVSLAPPLPPGAP